jgi:hypothetical protein
MRRGILEARLRLLDRLNYCMALGIWAPPVWVIAYAVWLAHPQLSLQTNQAGSDTKPDHAVAPRQTVALRMKQGHWFPKSTQGNVRPRCQRTWVLMPSLLMMYSYGLGSFPPLGPMSGRKWKSTNLSYSI